jgi:hypothetical protein
LLLPVSFGAAAQPAAERDAATPPLFTFETDELWLNLHHFLYVLGRAEAKLAPTGRASTVEDAPAESERGLPSLTLEERSAWAEAVRTYAADLSRRSPLDQAMAAPTRALADVDDVASLAGVPLDAALVAALERAAPIYRKTWWPEHRAANREWRSSTQALVDRHGAAVIEYVTKAYELPWPSGGFAVHVSGYANHGGSAYSSGFSGLLVVPSRSEFSAGWYALETIVHEAMHQWDGQVFDALRAQGSGSNVPRDLPHALVFYTAGEAVRSIEPSHVPMIDWLDLWAVRLSGASLPAERLKPLVVDLWKPHLEGRVTRDAALAVLMPRAVAVSQP